LAMPLEERRQRHATNYGILKQNDLSQWAERFLGVLERPEALRNDARSKLQRTGPESPYIVPIL
jgi:trehalose-6-phosphate synthase